MKCILFLYFACLFAACSAPGGHSASSQALAEDTIQYATGFTVRHFADYTQVEVRDPWDSTRLLQRYLLTNRAKPQPQGMPRGTILKIPVKRVVVYTSVHAAIIEQLRASDQIVGVCEPRYMDSPVIHEGLRSQRIADLGEATAPNVEKMVEVGAELVIASPFQNGSYGPVEKLGIPIVEGADYMESLPLGRTEWIRFYGLLFGKEQLADSLFRATEEAYLMLKERVRQTAYRPRVFSEKRYGSSWNIPNGDSYMAHFFKDAGADYLFADLPGSGSTPLAFETILDKAIHADTWLIKYNQADEMTYGGLRSEYTPYENFDAFKKQNIYGCNTGTVPYYEEFPLHPDYLLEDLVWIFHPELMPGYTPRYYKKLGN